MRPIVFQRATGTPPIITFDEVPCSEWGLSQGLTTPCRIFSGGKNSDGYGEVRFNGKMTKVHVYVWTLKNGPVPDDLEIDHVCRVRPCCNVDHLRAVTHKVNVTENIVGVNWQLMLAKTHCHRGHPFDEANTRVTKRGRVCRECERIGCRTRRASKRAINVELAQQNCPEP